MNNICRSFNIYNRLPLQCFLNFYNTVFFRASIYLIHLPRSKFLCKIVLSVKLFESLGTLWPEQIYIRSSQEQKIQRHAARSVDTSKINVIRYQVIQKRILNDLMTNETVNNHFTSYFQKLVFLLVFRENLLFHVIVVHH